jgi:hypothetical protein
MNFVELRGTSGCAGWHPAGTKKVVFKLLRVHAHQPYFELEISGFCVQTLISAFSHILTSTVDLMSSRIRAQVLIKTLWQIPGNILGLRFQAFARASSSAAL